MLSLPLIPPQPDVLRTHFRPRADSPPRQAEQPGLPHQRQQQAQRNNDAAKLKPDPRHPLALLAAEEAAIVQRKQAIRTFGSLWIRPPGISKTLQAMQEEAAEAAEREEMERQEQGLMDMRAQQQLQETREGHEAVDEGGDRDLDAEIPDADAAGEESGVGDVTFNEESMVEGSRENVDVDLEEAELTGAARDEEDLGILPEDHASLVEVERDLDNSIPEAGSYQHTDTEVEDSDSSEVDDSFVAQQASRAAMPAPGGLQERFRQQEGLTRSPGSLNLSSSLLESSFVGSSPVAQRGRGQGRRGRMS